LGGTGVFKPKQKGTIVTGLEVEAMVRQRTLSAEGVVQDEEFYMNERSPFS